MFRKILAGALTLSVLCACSRVPTAVVSSDANAPSAAMSDVPPTEPLPLIDRLTATTPIERIDDPAALAALWEDQLYWTFITISNGVRGFASVQEIGCADLASYLYLQMQLAEDFDGVVGASESKTTGKFGVPIEKLQAYCERYFDCTVDFTTNNSRTDFAYDEAAGLCRFHPQTLQSLEQVAYNQRDQWPYFALTGIDRYPDGYLIANTEMSLVGAIDEKSEPLRKRFLLRERADGSRYFISCAYEYTETNYISIEGKKTALPFLPELGTVLIMGNQTLLSMSADPAGNPLFCVFDYHSGKKLATQTLPLPANRYAPDFVGVRGGKLIVILGNEWGVWNADLSPVSPMAPLPKRLLDIFTAEGGIEGVDIDDSGRRISFISRDGAAFYDVDADTITRIPNTAPFTGAKMMAGTAFKTADFVDGGKKIFLWKVGYESTEGYLLYDIAADSTREYPYSGGYDIGRVLSEQGVYLTNHQDQNRHPLGAIYLDFSTGEVRPAPEYTPPEDGSAGVWSATRAPWSGRIETVKGGTPLSTVRVVVCDNRTTAVRDTGCTVTAPNGSVTVPACTPDGRAYVVAAYQGERFAFLTE